MCFPKEKMCHSVADDDIICYKVVYCGTSTGSYISLYKNFPYQDDATYKENSVGVAVLDELPLLTCGVFHSYQTLTASGIQSLSFNKHTRVIKCVIPKGTIYWENNGFDEYASITIKIIGEVSFDELMDYINDVY